MWRAIQRSQAWYWTSSRPSSAAPSREARAASFCPKRRAQRHDEVVRFSGGVLRVADDGGTKTRSITMRLASGRGCSFASNTASSTLLPLGVRATILLACYFAASGLQRGVLTPCSGAVRRPRCVPPSFPCKRQNRCQ
ncbi:hypothetical protein TcBrA4_0101450 [Trypanosoma cruzi]|nr:hypothetical protein TcBrA4_0101450 [Trypanosoma cruzi]